VNPGLSRRFAIEDAFSFTDFTTAQLEEIFVSKLKAQDLSVTPSGKAVAMEVLSRARVRPHFGNAGEVENMLGRAKTAFQSRQSRLPSEKRAFDVVFEPEDFDSDHARGDEAGDNLVELFKDMVGAESIIKKLRGIQQSAKVMKKRGEDYRENTPTTFVFKGPPGTNTSLRCSYLYSLYHSCC
jgi:hypothetical protein